MATYRLSQFSIPLQRRISLQVAQNMKFEESKFEKELGYFEKDLTTFLQTITTKTSDPVLPFKYLSIMTVKWVEADNKTWVIIAASKTRSMGREEKQMLLDTLNKWADTRYSHLNPYFELTGVWQFV